VDTLVGLMRYYLENNAAALTDDSGDGRHHARRSSQLSSVSPSEVIDIAINSAIVPVCCDGLRPTADEVDRR
jgi:hypothetical protein